MRRKSEFVESRSIELFACRLLPMLMLFLLPVAASAQTPDREWTHLAGPPTGRAGAVRWIQPKRGELFKLDATAIRTNYATIRPGQPSEAKTLGSQINLPMPDGTTARFAIVEAPVMDPELA
ncbi:MAG TPA: hypothetical protein VG347_19195, partial [Verrucomicrobiae bacterium]|nr:hypothetical protein [Verrucomicrobiae bacterium]